MRCQSVSRSLHLIGVMTKAYFLKFSESLSIAIIDCCRGGWSDNKNKAIQMQSIKGEMGGCGGWWLKRASGKKSGVAEGWRRGCEGCQMANKITHAAPPPHPPPLPPPFALHCTGQRVWPEDINAISIPTLLRSLKKLKCLKQMSPSLVVDRPSLKLKRVPHLAEPDTGSPTPPS